MMPINSNESTIVQRLEQFVVDAVEVIDFSLIRSKEDVENPAFKFRPVMSHQIFGDSESIFGYVDIKVRIMYSAGPMQVYIGTEYKDKVENMPGNMKSDDVVAAIAAKLPDGCYFVSLSEFLKTLDKAEKFQPYGEKLSEFKIDSEKKERVFEFYHCDHKSAQFLKFFVRLETLVLWFVDAASYIDIDDPQWSYFVCYEKFKNGNGDYQYATVGYITVYEYYAYPQNTRPRISQMLILPPFQNLHIGAKFLETIYQFYQVQPNVVDITVEDPSENFKRLRNFVDSRMCLNLPCFSKINIKKGFTPEMKDEAKKVYKVNPRQCRKVYEILRLYHTDTLDEKDYTEYRLDIKKRLNTVYHKQMQDIKRMEKVNVDTQWMKAALPSLADRLYQLGEEYSRLEKDYFRIVQKLKA